MPASELHPTLSQRVSPTQIALLILLLIAGSVARFHRIGEASFWTDELLTLEFACGYGHFHSRIPDGQVLDPAPSVTRSSHALTLAQIFEAQREDTHPPLHPMLVRMWRATFGDADGPTRALSALLSLLAVLLLFDAVRWTTGTAPALWAAAIMSFAGMQIEFAQENRGYMMLLTTSLMVMSAAARIGARGANSGNLIYFAISMLAAMLTHYFAALICAACAFHVLRFTNNRSRVLFAIALGAFIYLVVWGPTFFIQRNNFVAQTDWLADGDPHLTMQTLERLARTPFRQLFESAERMQPVTRIGILLYIVPIPWLRRRNDLLFWWLCGAPVLFMVTCMDLFQRRQHLVYPRYTLIASASTYALLAIIAARSARWMRRAIPAIALLGCLLALPQAWTRLKHDWRYFAHSAASDLTRDDLLVLGIGNNNDWFGGLTYLAIDHYAGFKSPVLVLHGPPNRSVMLRLLKARTIRVVVHQGGPTEQEILPGFNFDFHGGEPRIATAYNARRQS